MKSLNPIALDWNLYFAKTSGEAVELLRKYEIDVLISDITKTGTAGAELLDQAKEIHPSSIRILISGQLKKEKALEASKSAHQILGKPVDIPLLLETVEKCVFLQMLLRNPEIKKIANGVKNFPSLPELFIEIEKELKKPDPSLKRIDNIISKDPAMTVKILQVVNSAYFSPGQKIINPLEAINFLGIDVIKALVLVVNFFSIESDNEEFNVNLSLLWEESMKTAALSKKIAKSEKIEPALIDAIFISGLLHEIGKFIMWQLEEYFTLTDIVARETKKSLVEIEYSLYKTSHAEVGAYLLGLWGLPEILIKLIYYHHQPSRYLDTYKIPAAIIHTADHIMTKTPLDEEYLKDSFMESTVKRWIRIFSNKV